MPANLRVHVLVVVTVVALVAAACGGSESGESQGVASIDSTATTAATAAPPAGSGADGRTDEEAVLAFSQCMRDEGIDIPDPTVDADGNLRLNLGRAAAAVAGVDEDVLNAAFLSCQQHLQGVSFGFDVGDPTELEDRLLRFAACMRDNGVDLPDPDFSRVGEDEPGDGPFGRLDISDPVFQDALDVCGDILAGFDDE